MTSFLSVSYFKTKLYYLQEYPFFYIPISPASPFVLVKGNGGIRSHTSTHIHGRTPLYERSAHHRGRYLHDTHETDEAISMPPAGLEPAVPTSERPQNCALDRTATGLRYTVNFIIFFYFIVL